jgi:hypothetical protein
MPRLKGHHILQCSLLRMRDSMLRGKPGLKHDDIPKGMLMIAPPG